MAKKSGVYQIVNEVNGKSYVGSSVDILKRWKQWKFCDRNHRKYRSLLVSAFQKYGLENLTFIVLEECPPTRAALEYCEQRYMDLLRPEYNVLKQAYRMAGYKYTEKQKETLRQSFSTE